MATAPATPINRNNDWKEVHAPKMFSFERVNDKLVGEYHGPEIVTVKGKETTQYVVKTGDDQVYTCLATYDLKSKMAQVPLPIQDKPVGVSITYEGEDLSVQTQGSPLRKFKVMWKYL